MHEQRAPGELGPISRLQASRVCGVVAAMHLTGERIAAPQPDTGAAAIWRDELDAGGLEGPHQLVDGRRVGRERPVDGF